MYLPDELRKAMAAAARAIAAALAGDRRPPTPAACPALFSAAEPNNAVVARVVAEAHDQFVVSPYVLAELDYLVGTRIGGCRAGRAPGTRQRRIHLATVDLDQLATAADVVHRYRATCASA